ncbi:uncharacterized protein LOC142175166 [Nicotiana tabacum]|uniref:Uncharacterized protein LOC142175166 n=1 Tax=Nicotiana tabacum TaxID=4097 RepID=A0AC58TKU2_TOBAC
MAPSSVATEVEVRWIVDTGASNHMVKSLKILEESRSADETSIGKDLFNERVRGIGKEDEGLYIYISGNKYQTNGGGNNNLDSGRSFVNTIKYDSSSVSLWHRRLGHVPLDVLGKLKCFQHLKCNSDTKQCIVCPIAKKIRLPFPLSTSVATACFTYFMLMFGGLIEQFFIMIKNVHSCTVNFLRTDNACYVTDVKRGDKFSPRASPVIFLRYSMTQKGYRIIDIPQVLLPNDVSISYFSPSLISYSPHTPFSLSSPISTSPSHHSIDQPTQVPVEPEPLSTSNDQLIEASHPRRSGRTSKPPIWLKDYVTLSQGKANCSYPLSACVSYENISDSYAKALSSYSAVVEPQSYAEAVKDPKWIEAIKAEISALEENHTWSIVELPTRKVPIGCKWVFKVKYTSSGEVERYKARLVAKDYSQKEGLDYTETFSPVAKMVIVRSVIAVAAAKQRSLFQMDVLNAFLHGELLEEVYMDVPQGFASQEASSHKVCKLYRSLYGLKQAPKQWNRKLTDALVQLGFIQSYFDYSLFTKKVQAELVVVLVYVDDLIISGSSLGLITQTRNDLKLKFKMKDLGELKFFLGIEVARSKDRIIMSQRKYALELISEMGLAGAKPAGTPLESNLKLTSIEYDTAVGASECEDKLIEDIGWISKDMKDFPPSRTYDFHRIRLSAEFYMYL